MQPEPLRVQDELRLLQVLQQADLQPVVINLNNPLVASGTVVENERPTPVLFSHPPAAVSWTLHLVGDKKLVTAVMLRPAAWERSGDGAGFTVTVQAVRTRRLFHRVVSPRQNMEDRGWIPVEVDLSPWAHQAIRLTLSTDSGPGQDPTYDWAVWRDPVLVSVSEKDSDASL